MRSPCNVMSSAVLAITVSRAVGYAWRTPSVNFEPPTPPAKITICTAPVLQCPLCSRGAPEAGCRRHSSRETAEAAARLARVPHGRRSASPFLSITSGRSIDAAGSSLSARAGAYRRSQRASSARELHRAGLSGLSRGSPTWLPTTRPGDHSWSRNSPLSIDRKARSCRLAVSGRYCPSAASGRSRHSEASDRSRPPLHRIGYGPRFGDVVSVDGLGDVVPVDSSGERPSRHRIHRLGVAQRSPWVLLHSGFAIPHDPPGPTLTRYESARTGGNPAAAVLPREPLGATSVDTLKGVENLMRLREPAAWVALGAWCSIFSSLWWRWQPSTAHFRAWHGC